VYNKGLEIKTWLEAWKLQVSSLRCILKVINSGENVIEEYEFSEIDEDILQDPIEMLKYIKNKALAVRSLKK
jgi:hypothetical protein